MNEIAPQDPFRPMLAQSSINAGAVAIESERAIAEARGKIQVAKMFPRSMAQAMAEFMEEGACVVQAQQGGAVSCRFREIVVVQHNGPRLQEFGLVAEGAHHSAQVVGIDRDFRQIATKVRTLDG